MTRQHRGRRDSARGRAGIGWARIGRARRVGGPVIVVLVTIAAVLGGSGGTATAAAAAVQVDTTRLRVGPEPDGTAVDLDLTVYTPAVRGTGGPTARRHPVVLLAHGFGGSKDDLTGTAQSLAGSGYLVVTYTARGFAGSGGRVHLNDPRFEVADAVAVVDWVSTRPDVDLDGPGDPRLAVAGVSYGGALALMLAGADQRVDVVAAAITWFDLGEAFFAQSAQVGARLPASPAGSEPIRADGVFKRRWASAFFSATVLGDGPNQPVATGVCGRFDPTVCAAMAEAARSGSPPPGLADLLREHSPAQRIGEVRAPTLLLPGLQDSLFGLDQADATARALAAAGVPVRVRWLAGGHDAPADVRDQDSSIITGELSEWLGRFLPIQTAGSPPPEPRADPPTADRGQPDQVHSWSVALPATGDTVPAPLSMPGYPSVGADPTPWASLRLSGTGGRILSPPGGDPAATTVLPGAVGALAGVLGEDGGQAGFALAALPGQSVVFETTALDRPLTIGGGSRIGLSVRSTASDATLFVSLWRVTSSGRPSLPYRVVAPVRVPTTPGVVQSVSVALAPTCLSLRPGDRLRVVVSATDSAFTVPTDARFYDVALIDPQLQVPVPFAAADTGSRSPIPADRWWLPWLLMITVLGAVAAGLTSTVRSRRVDRRDFRQDLADLPLVVQSLHKTYRGGQRAVHGVSWRAEPGQVVGLLGPNGAGKTTTIRMVVGLIRPDDGHVHIFGHPVHPGSPALARIGALIEGPGFLPHLSGRQNLAAYWAATGRPAERADVDAVLEIAGLGTAVDRPVRTYSHGMKQRLGIAQAMLGMPSLLILDEPTNGLDPPQIAAMRQVLIDYAATGRTVVVSSHLLGEVERTCSHAVLMVAGRVVAAGPMADLTAGDGAVVIGVEADPAVDNADLIASTPGVRGVRPAGPHRFAVETDDSRAQLVASLVRSGVRVCSVSDRGLLEDVFLGVVSGSVAATGDRSGDDLPVDVAATGGSPR